MKYTNIISGTFISRPNRFIAKVNINGTEETVHVKNTGRCKELLVKDSQVWLEVSDNPSRKTRYDLIAVKKERNKLPSLIINMDSQIPNSAAEEWLKNSGLFHKNALIEREKFWGDSRFDIRITDGEKLSFMEVKGVTLERDGIAYFPDAPTERGVKHRNGLISLAEQGYGAYLLFVVQMKGIREFRPNDDTHKEFGDTLRKAIASGVKCIAYDCIVTPDSILIDKEIPIVTE
ncbi:MAG: DNA/RNA nuclease SfsA [Ruminococcus sp.]|nr:DNA/RNA nuclease SfsA [Ruminococcus sp.]